MKIIILKILFRMFLWIYPNDHCTVHDKQDRVLLFTTIPPLGTTRTITIWKSIQSEE